MISEICGWRELPTQPKATMADDTAAYGAATAYERLERYRNAHGVDTQKDVMRCLTRASVPEAQKEALQAMEQRELVHFLCMRRDRRRDDVERISERRSQTRARGRDKWRGVVEDAVSIDEIKRHLPGLFQQEVSTLQSVRQSGGDNRSLPRSTPPIEPPRVSSNVSVAASVPAVPMRRAPTPPFEEPVVKQPPPMPAPQRALSELLKRRRVEAGDDDDDESMPYPPRPQQYSEPVSRNPFQTAGDRLQRDRAQGKHTTYDSDGDINDSIKRNGRGLSRQTPKSGGYHPINPHLLLGGGAPEENDPDNDIGGGDAIRKKFVSPVVKPGDDKKSGRAPGQQSKPTGPAPEEDEDIDPRLKSCDPELIAKIEMEIVDNGDPVTFDDIAGLQFAKKCVNELVIWPMARPDIFTGLRALPKGLLLFGPPGTGKTLIGKAIASQSGATFFSISASSLTSKWIGEGEKLVRTLFAVAAVKQPSVIFIDEIDSLLTQRSSEENEASRRMKTEFLVQLDGAGTKAKDVILVVGATNRPQELDEAARRRFVKRLYIPLPSSEARLDLISRLLKGNRHELSDIDLKYIADKTSGYSGADVRALCTEAAMGPIRSCSDIRNIDADSVRPINLHDCEEALRGVRSSVAAKDLEFYKQWNDEFGSFAFTGHEG